MGYRVFDPDLSSFMPYIFRLALAVSSPQSHIKLMEKKTSDTELKPSDQDPKDTDLVKDEPKEIGGPKGPEPTRFGDWEKGGRCTDF